MRLGPLGKLRIAQVAPLSESVPPKLYGGTERVVAVLTDELVRQGHAVTLFASGDSRTTATLVPVCEKAQRLAGCVDPLSAHMLMIEQIAQRAKDFDIIHYHVAPVHFPLARRMNTAHLTTMHGRLDLPDLVPLYEEFCELPLVSISDAQRSAAPSPELGGDGAPRVSRARFLLSSRARSVSRVSRTHLAREACRSRYCDCQGLRMAAQNRRESRSDGRAVFQE